VVVCQRTLVSSPVPSPPALRVEYVVLDLVTLSRMGARGLLLNIGMTILLHVSLCGDTQAYLSIIDKLLERLGFPIDGRQESILLERVGVCHLIHPQRQTGITILIHLFISFVHSRPCQLTSSRLMKARLGSYITTNLGLSSCNMMSSSSPP